MRKITIVLIMLVATVSSAQKYSLEVVKHKYVTTAERNLYVVPTGEVWRIYNSTTGQWERNDGGAGWVADTGVSSGTMTAPQIKTALETLTGIDRLNASAIEGLPSSFTTELSEDLSPVLGANLDGGGFSIGNISQLDVSTDISATILLLQRSDSFAGDVAVHFNDNAGNANVLFNDQSDQNKLKYFNDELNTTIELGSGTTELSEDLSPVLSATLDAGSNDIINVDNINATGIQLNDGDATGIRKVGLNPLTPAPTGSEGDIYANSVSKRPSYHNGIGWIDFLLEGDVTGSGDVSKVGTPLINRIAVWDGDGPLAVRNLSFNNERLQISTNTSKTVDAPNIMTFGSNDGAFPLELRLGRRSTGTPRFEFQATNQGVGRSPIIFSPDGGNIGIANSNPLEALDVTGNILASGTITGNVSNSTITDTANNFTTDTVEGALAELATSSGSGSNTNYLVLQTGTTETFDLADILVSGRQVEKLYTTNETVTLASGLSQTGSSITQALSLSGTANELTIRPGTATLYIEGETTPVGADGVVFSVPNSTCFITYYPTYAKLSGEAFAVAPSAAVYQGANPADPNNEQSDISMLTAGTNATFSNSTVRADTGTRAIRVSTSGTPTDSQIPATGVVNGTNYTMTMRVYSQTVSGLNYVWLDPARGWSGADVEDVTYMQIPTTVGWHTITLTATAGQDDPSIWLSLGSGLVVDIDTIIFTAN